MAAIPMARFVRVTDSRTIVVAHLNGPEEVVHLVNVDVPAEDEMAARAFIQDNLARTFVYVEDGKVYRSTDALFINRELAYGAYASPGVKTFYLGEVNPGPRAQAAPRTTPARVLVQSPKKAPRSAPRHHSRRR
ncbi:MAG: hypothetical protein QOC81_4560 [Thermoanaerobaculia bacterium]|nr:hypothetical protein [Thermoanaerobaculia bacterium]